MFICYEYYDYYYQGASIMYTQSKYSHLEDLKRIKSGYMPKTHFIFLYDILTVLFVSKLCSYRMCRNVIAGIFNDKNFHKVTNKGFGEKDIHHILNH